VLIKFKFSEEKIMDNIFLPNDQFDFSQLSLAHPTGIQGGAYFTKIQMNGKPLYIETPKSLTRQGFVKNGKKIYCDLMFDNNDEQLIHWLESLETKCQELIYKKAETWFENKLELSDIESAFASPMRIYKSGKYYLVRVNAKVNYTTSSPVVKIYNENETPISFEDVTPENNIISIVEVQGIKFTSRNFQIELELKQSMVLNSEKIFDSCIIKSGLNKHQAKPNQEIAINEKNLVINAKNSTILEDNKYNQDNNVVTLENVEELEEINDRNPNEIVEEISEKLNTMNVFSNNAENEKKAEIKIDTAIETLSDIEELIDTSNDLTEVNLTPMSPDLETITLKKPNQVYYEIYKAARNKAKEAKKQAILAFLEAKNIKKTYMLEGLDDSEDSDMDFDDLSEVSENDLEKEE
jgi:hypothetical protein